MVKSQNSQESMVKDINAFGKKFNLPQTEGSELLDERLMAFRIAFMQEELDETLDAYQCEDIEAVFDGLLDLAYVVLGTAWMMNLPFEEGWQRVHHANMQKVRVDNVDESKRGSPYDLKKPDGWRPPYLEDLLL